MTYMHLPVLLTTDRLQGKYTNSQLLAFHLANFPNTSCAAGAVVMPEKTDFVSSN